MNHMALVSIVIPAYNADQVLDRCIKSIQGQVINDIEIIVINNGSTDKTGQIIEKYRNFDCRIQEITVMPNRGVSNARNIGLEQAQGKYILFCDSDDAYTIHGIEQCYQLAEREHADVVVANFTQLCDDEIYSPLMARTNLEAKSEFLAFFDTGVIWNKLYRKSFLLDNNISFRPYNYGEDTLFLGECYICDPHISVCPDCMYLHYHRRNSAGEKQLTRKYTANALREYLEVGMKLYKMPLVCDKVDFVTEYLRYLRHVYEFWWNIPDQAAVYSTFSDIREFTRIIQWNEDYQRNEFHNIFGIDYLLFQKVSVDTYITFKLLSQVKVPQEPTQSQFVDYAAKVNDMYRHGELGFRYIIRYILSWFAYKRGKRE